MTFSRNSAVETALVISDTSSGYRNSISKGLDAVAEAEKVQVTPEDMNYEIYAMAQNFGADPKEVWKIISKEGRVSMLASSVARKKAAGIIISNAKGAKDAAKDAAKEETK